MIDIKVPPVGESINEVTLLKWNKADGAWVERDEVIAELESEKATFEINAEQSGKLQHIAKEGDVLEIGGLICRIEVSSATASAPAPSAVPSAPVATVVSSTENYAT
ncbi:MAG: biotin/lipoyl-containing protein, partial [Chitinophagaceae bacterium]